MKRILIIEDDPAIAAGLEAGLTDAHFTVETESDGQRGYTKALKYPPDVLILDLSLPSKNGEDICLDLRREGFDAPILMLTSKNEVYDKVLGLELGADDYMTKPFSLRELQARVKALLRRGTAVKEPEEATAGEIWMNFKTLECTKCGEPVELTAREFEVLKYMMLHVNEVVTRDMLLTDVWGYDQFPTTRTVDNYILAIRKKIEENPADPRYLRTVHTAGYKFVS